MHWLATAMAALSGLEKAVLPISLVTSDQEVEQFEYGINPLSPPKVTKVVKTLVSGKLERISIYNDVVR